MTYPTAKALCLLLRQHLCVTITCRIVFQVRIRTTRWEEVIRILKVKNLCRGHSLCQGMSRKMLRASGARPEVSYDSVYRCHENYIKNHS